jgi:hypothetical protein
VFETYRAGNCFYVEDCTVRTPVPGLQASAKVRRLRQELIEAELAAQQVAGSLAEHFFWHVDGGEM